MTRVVCARRRRTDRSRTVANGTYMVNKANVVCGNVQTANATVYIINTVLMPPSS